MAAQHKGNAQNKDSRRYGLTGRQPGGCAKGQCSGKIDHSQIEKGFQAVDLPNFFQAVERKGEDGNTDGLHQRISQNLAQ